MRSFQLLVFSFAAVGCQSFQSRGPLLSTRPVVASVQQDLFFADEGSKESSILLTPSKEDEKSIEKAAAFMVDSFWLGSRHIIDESGSSLSDAARNGLFEEQFNDLMDKYGERMGKRILETCLLEATDEESGELLGMVCISVGLFDKASVQILSAEESESAIKNAVASLGPKQRRMYKDSSVEEIATELLPPHLQPVCVLSNLAVSPKARRRGVALQLCDEVERIASVEWGYESMFLKVEKDNEPARRLYEDKLGYKLGHTIAADTVLRVDVQKGSFMATEADSLILIKDI